MSLHNQSVAKKGLARRAVDAGTFKNALKLLTSDYKKINSKALQNVTGLGASEMARLTGVSRPLFYRPEIPLKPGSRLMKSIISLVIMTDLAYELFGSNFEETKKWLMLPNAMLFAESPFEVCIRGDGQKLIDWLHGRLGKPDVKLAG